MAKTLKVICEDDGVVYKRDAASWYHLLMAWYVVVRHNSQGHACDITYA